MPKNPKPKNVEKLEGNSSSKKKGAKQKLSDSSKSKNETEEILSLVIEDERWQCSTFLLVPETHSLYDFLLQTLVNLPDNFTVITKDAIANTMDKNSRKSSKPRTSIRSTSKSSKKSGKSKSPYSKNKTKKEDGAENLVDESSNYEVVRFKACLALKKLIIGLKNTDIANVDKYIKESKTDTPESKIKNKDVKARGFGDPVDSKETVAEKNLPNNESFFHRFVILLGFYDHMLPEVLDKQNVPIKAIINVRNSFGDDIDSYSNERLSTFTAKSKRKSSGKIKKVSLDGKVSNEYSVFLEKIVAFSKNTEFLEKCKNVVFLNYTVNNFSIKTKEFGFKYKLDMLGMFYKIKDAWNKYKSYTETIHVLNIPTANDTIKLDDARIYRTMISMMPLECTSTAVILHCIVEQISWWNDGKCIGEENNSNTTLHRSTFSSKPFGKNITPILIHHRDDVKNDTFHLDLPEFDFEQISINVFMKSPVYKLWERYPPHLTSVRKWFEYQLQKLQNLSDDREFKLESLFPIYLHYLLMDVLIFKTNQLTNPNDDSVSSGPNIKKGNEILFSEKEPKVCDSNANLFIKEIIYTILCKVPSVSLSQNYAEVFEVVSQSSINSTEYDLKQPVYANRLRNNSSKQLSSETLLQKRELHKQEKIDKLVSFLNCSEFVNLYEDFSKLNFCETNRLEKYGFIEFLNTQTLCQCLQTSYQTFGNVNYDYFPVTDSILLWFNNSVQQRVPSSSTSKVVLDTVLGFRDFYFHKLRESTYFGDTIKGEVTKKKSLEENGDLFADNFLESSSGFHSKVEYNKEKFFGVEAPKPTIVYNLGSLWVESTESFNNYFSVDSSSVTVKRVKYFDSNEQVVVNVNKNNTSIRYDLDPESSNNFVQLFIDVHETLHLNCILKWDTDSEKLFIQKNNTEFLEDFGTRENSKFKLNCCLNITLPSGLFIEIVPTNSIFGPFYVRQKYLGKGPVCSNIWEESYRCFLNNGMVLVFRVDGSVDILYSNGTTVKCHRLELTKPVELPDAKDKKTDTNFKASVERVNKTKEDPNNQPKKKGKVKADKKKPLPDADGEDTNNKSQKKKDKLNKELQTTKENNKEEILSVKEIKDNDTPLYKVVQHSVLSWDGEYSDYDSGNGKNKKKCLNLRTAFDIINHELYWQRSDGASGLQAPGNFTISFPDGSKTTSFMIDNKELWVENDCMVIYYNNGDLVKVESLAGSHNTGISVAEINKDNIDSNHKKQSFAADISSTDSFSTKSLEEKRFIYVDNRFLMEHTNYASVEYTNEEHELKLGLPGNCLVMVDKNGNFSYKGDKNERIFLFNDSLVFEANVLSSSTLSKSCTIFRFENVDTIPTVLSQTEDSFGNVFSVDERGNTTYLSSVNGEYYDQPLYTARVPQNTERFFVFNRDLTGYEMIHDVEHINDLSNQDVKTVHTPLIKDDNELYSLYMQSPIYRSKSEQYLTHDIENLTPSLIKRKDLLKAQKTPETIWFHPKLSSVKKLTVEIKLNTAQKEKILKAIMTTQRLRVKKKGLDVALLFSNALTKYVEFNEQIYQKYLNYHLKETLKEEDLIESEKNRTNFLGSKSYYLTDNLPVVVTGDTAEKQTPNIDIFSIFSPSVSKVSV